MVRNLKPVSIAGIEFDALMDEQKTMNSMVPSYPIEDGFTVSDTIILEPLSLQMTLYISNTPVTWLYRHGNSNDRVREICDKLEELWESKTLVKVVTTEAIYTNMAVTSMTIKKSTELGYSREVQLTLQKVNKTKKKTVKIPSYILKSGDTQANAGTATTSSTSTKSNSTGSSGSSSESKNNSEKAKSILYGIADGLGF